MCGFGRCAFCFDSISQTHYVIDAPTEDSRTVKFGYMGSKRFVQALATATGSHSSGTPIGIIAVQGNPSVAPQNDA